MRAARLFRESFHPYYSCPRRMIRAVQNHAIVQCGTGGQRHKSLRALRSIKEIFYLQSAYVLLTKKCRVHLNTMIVKFVNGHLRLVFFTKIEKSSTVFGF